jgi:hypothetical protein
MYTGNNNPPARSDFTVVNESHNGTGNSSDGTAYGYWFDRANLSINFYVVKSKIYGNLLGPGNTTRVYADTWYIRNNGRWNRADRAPNRSQTVNYTMVPEFQDIIAPVAGSVLVYVIIRRRKSGGRAIGRRDASRGSAVVTIAGIQSVRPESLLPTRPPDARPPDCRTPVACCPLPAAVNF